MSSISNNAIRDLNKIDVYDGHKKVLTVFAKAGAPGPKMDFKVDTKDYLKQLTEGPIAGLAGAYIGQMTGGVTGITGYFDIAQRGMFQSVQNLTNTVDGFIPITSTFSEVEAQLKEVLPYILPSRNGSYIDLTEYVQEMEKSTQLREKEGLYQFAHEVFTTAAEVANDWIGRIYNLNPPTTMRVKDKAQYLSIRWGRCVFYDVLIKSFSISMPQCFMKDSHGEAMPDHIDISMTFESMRRPCLVNDDTHRDTGEEGLFTNNIKL